MTPFLWSIRATRGMGVTRRGHMYDSSNSAAHHTRHEIELEQGSGQYIIITGRIRCRGYPCRMQVDHDLLG